jgi:ABC-type nitrate/sulfonate/bicarbonate transport system substrate-binding protein
MSLSARWLSRKSWKKTEDGIWECREVKLNMTKTVLTLGFFFLSSVFGTPASAQERVIVSHSVRGSLSIGPLLYGIQKGFYRDEGIDLLYVSITAPARVSEPQSRVSL